jgi:hypothetical protein
MPQIDFYLDTQDNYLVLEKMFSLGARLVPDLHYSTDEYKEYASITELEKDHLQTRNFFVVHKFSHLPLETYANTANGKEWFAIMPRNGGPALTLLIGGQVTKDKVMLVRPGNLHYYRTYWDPVAKCNHAAPLAEKEFFGLMQRWTMDNFTRLQSNRTYWIGPGAANAVRKGSKLVGFESFSTAKLIRLLDLRS